MSPLLRRLLIAFAVFVLLLGGAAAWLVASFDAERVKALAVDWMKIHRDRTLSLAGPLELSVFPKLQVRLSRASLSEPGSTAVFVSLDEASLSLAWWPLLSKSLVIDGVSARGLHLAYTRDPQGVSNIDDLLGKGTADAPGRGEPAAASGTDALRFDVSRVEVTDLQANVQDALSGVKGEIAVASLVSGRLADKTESPLKLQAQLALASPAVRGSLTGETRLALDLANNAVSLREMALTFKGELPGASGVDATLKGALAWNSAQGSLLAEGLTLNGGATLGSLKLSDSSLALQRFAVDPKQQSLSLDRLALRLQGAASGRPLKLALDWPQLGTKGKTLQGSALSGTLALDGETRLAGSFKSGPPQGDFAQIVVPAFEANWTGGSGALKLGGRLAGDLTLRWAERALALGKLDLALQLQGSPPLALALRGDASVSASQARWTLAGQVGGDNASTQGSAVFGGKVPALQVQARFDALDLNALLPPPAKTAATSPPAAGTEDGSVDLTALHSLNGRFDLRAGSVAWRASRFRDTELQATLDGGRLNVSTLRANAWGGSIEASGAADANGHRVAVKALANGVDINAMERELTGRDILEGRGRLALDVQTAGQRHSDLRSHVQGTASLQLRDGAVKGINLAKSLRQARAALAAKSDTSTASVQAEKTDFSELSISFRIDNGVARSNDLVLKSPYLRLGGDGAIDIGQASIDYTVRATAVVAPVGQDGPDLLALKGLTVPVHLSGPLSAIQWKVRWSTVALATVQNQVKALLGGALQPAGPGASNPSGATQRKQLTEQLLKGLFK